MIFSPLYSQHENLNLCKGIDTFEGSTGGGFKQVKNVKACFLSAQGIKMVSGKEREGAS